MSYTDKFLKYCQRGELKLAQKVYYSKDIDIHANNEEAFRWVGFIIDVSHL